MKDSKNLEYRKGVEDKMIKYYMTELSSHLDEGFGVTAHSFYKAAEVLPINEDYNSAFNPQKQLPVLYLYRHSIELFAKSLILIMHRKLKLNFGMNNDILTDCKNPVIYNNKRNEWVELYKCHDIKVILDYLMKVVNDNIELLKKEAPRATWSFKYLNYDDVNTINNYDFDSTFFRYPVTRDRGKDKRKESFKRFTNIKKMKPKENIVLLIQDNEGDFVEGFQMVDNVLNDLEKALKEVSMFFNEYHIMTRMELLKGW